MALSDSEQGKKDKRNKRRAVDAGSNFRWSDSQKLEAVQSWLALGNIALCSRILSIPEITLRYWKQSEWWSKAVEEIRLSENVQLSNRMKKLVEASHTIVAQRLENGDPVLTKGGDLIYKPVSLRDAHRVAVDLIDRRKDIDKLTTEKGSTEQKDDDKLERLAERFAEMATKSIEKQINKKRTVEMDATDAIYDERQAGLQTGVRSLPRETGTDQEAVGENDGPEGV